ncbi:uncharacterized protein DNG_09253 [Cephalotrichum gorgonifer]|uniref:FHA domain-containing protein n=1 Tax=Cephalotrichum gorgonifer TaxID=2041049 RepID=A0AAE8N7F1_9PEZI|nr:uncharacterized protein DNG_09253 [Cephalotrichum gorgonifer]
MDSDTIAWLVPSFGNPLALQAIQNPQNAALSTPSLPLLASSPPPLLSPLDNTPYTGPALRLSLSHRPKSHLGLLMGTDPSCDVVLPKLPGISRRHCHLTFDAESRLVLRDTSKNGTAVWYDDRSNGDKRDFTWVLSSGAECGFPDRVGTLVVDIQTVRFQVVVNPEAGRARGYVRRVDDFLMELAGRREAAVAPLFSGRTAAAGEAGRRGRERGFVKHTVEEEGKGPQTFLWNVARPWDPVIPVYE